MTQLVTQPSPLPTRKVGAGALGGAAATAAIFGLQAAGIEVTAEQAGAIATLASFALSYLIRERAP